MCLQRTSTPKRSALNKASAAVCSDVLPCTCKASVWPAPHARTPVTTQAARVLKEMMTDVCIYIYTCRERERQREILMGFTTKYFTLFYICFKNTIHLTHGGIMFNVVQPKPAIPRSSSLQQHQVVLPDPWFGDMHHLAATRTYRSEAREKTTW